MAKGCYTEKCKRCVWGTDTGGRIFCMFPSCPFYKFITKNEGVRVKVDKSCASCRKKDKCSRNGIVKRCELYSPNNMSFIDRTCAICGTTHWVEEHHIFGAANRKRSDKDGLTIDLCHKCHRTGRNAVHQDAETASKIKKLGQREYEKAYGEGSFLKEYGRNYL